MTEVFDPSKFGCVITPDIVNVSYKGQFASRFRSEIGDDSFEELKQLYREGKNEELLAAVEVLGRIRRKTIPGVEFVPNTNKVLIDGKAVRSDVLVQYLIDYDAQGFPIDALVAFTRRVRQNPSYRAVTALFGCLEANRHPILPDGRFLAWKGVWKNSEGNLFDIYTKKINNNVGAKPSMPRNEVDENPNRSCSYGLHIASFEYATDGYANGRDKVLIEVAVAPENVVAIPDSYDSSKMRVCEYEVLAINNGDKAKEVYVTFDD